MSKRLIYAEDAIDALCKVGCESGYCGVSCDDVKAIEQLPSAQPQSCKDAVSKADVLETYAELYDVFDDNKEIKNELHKIYDKINALQATQPQRMRGEWIEDGYNHYKAVCSECGEPCATYVMGKPRDNFCKWCGADMRGDEDAAD